MAIYLLREGLGGFFFFDVKEGPIMGFQKTSGMLEAKLPAGVLKLILPLIPSKGTMTNNNEIYHFHMTVILASAIARARFYRSIQGPFSSYTAETGYVANSRKRTSSRQTSAHYSLSSRDPGTKDV